MSKKLFVGRLADGTTNDDLHSLFRKFGNVTECTVLGNYGFVHMASDSEAKAALAELDGSLLKGNHIHVELSTAVTQGRKKRMESGGESRSGGRFEPYPAPRYAEPAAHYPSTAAAPADRDRYAAPREDFASEQVKDLLELYFRDPIAFDQYAKTYYYGERAERERAAAARVYYDRRVPAEVVYAPVIPRRDDEMMRVAAAVAKPSSSSYATIDYALSRSSSSTVAVRGDDRYRASGAPMSSSSLYSGGRL